MPLFNKLFGGIRLWQVLRPVDHGMGHFCGRFLRSQFHCRRLGLVNPNSRLSGKLLQMALGVSIVVVAGCSISDTPRRQVDHGEESRMMRATRIKVKFPSVDAYRIGAAVDFPGAEVQLSSEQRRFVVLESSDAADADAAQQAATMLQQKYGATIVEDYQYTID